MYCGDRRIRVEARREGTYWQVDSTILTQFKPFDIIESWLGRERLIALQDERLLEKEQLKVELTQARRDLPACSALLESFVAAAQLSTRLNVSFLDVVSKMNAVDV